MQNKKIYWSSPQAEEALDVAFAQKKAVLAESDTIWGLFCPTFPAGVKELVDGANQFDADLFMSAFGEGALVNDRHRQFWGSEAIRRWCEIEITGDRVTIEPVEVVEHYGDVIVTAKFDGDYDKSDLPPELYLQLYCALRNNKIVQLILLPMDGRPLSKATETSIAATAYSAELPKGARSPLDVGR